MVDTKLCHKSIKPSAQRIKCIITKYWNVYFATKVKEIVNIYTGNRSQKRDFGQDSHTSYDMTVKDVY